MTTYPLNMSLPGYTGEITAGIAGALLLILCIISLILYRNWRYEQELDSLLWKIDFKELTVHESDKDLSEKKQTRVRIDIPIAGGPFPGITLCLRGSVHYPQLNLGHFFYSFVRDRRPIL